MLSKRNGHHRSGQILLLIVALAVLVGASVQRALGDKRIRGAGASFYTNFTSLDQRFWLVSDGWSNGPHQGCKWTGKNLKLEAGKLDLKLTELPAMAKKPMSGTATKAEPKGQVTEQYRCAEIQTIQAYDYGTYEARMKAAAGPGLVSAFFTYIGPGQGGPKPHDEIDFEFLGKDKRKVQLNYFANGKGGHEHMVDLGFDASSRYANYAFEWLPNTIKWYVDGRLVHEVTRKAGEDFPHEPSKVMISLWNGTNQVTGWLGSFAYPGKPLKASYQHIAFTRQGDACQFPTSVVCRKK